MNTRHIVCGIIQYKGKVLLGKKSKGRPPYPDVWHTPGGGVENNTLAEQLITKKDFDNKYFHSELQREMREELGVIIKNINCIVPQFRNTPREAVTKNKLNEDTHYYFLEYLCEVGNENFSSGDDLAEAKWVLKEKLNKISLTPPSMEMYKELGWLK